MSKGTILCGDMATKDKMNDLRMKMDLDKKGLISLVKGTSPSYELMESPLIAKCGRYYGGFDNEWVWRDLDQLTEQELVTVYELLSKQYDETTGL